MGDTIAYTTAIIMKSKPTIIGLAVTPGISKFDFQKFVIRNYGIPARWGSKNGILKSIPAQLTNMINDVSITPKYKLNPTHPIIGFYLDK